MSHSWRIAGINFDHFHMGDLLRMVFDHPHADIVGICDEQPERMSQAAANFEIDESKRFTDFRTCLQATKPDVVILCPATAEHAIWTTKVAEYPVHILIEKPFASSLAEADQMIAAMRLHGKQLAINWPLRWYPPHVTCHRLIREGHIGKVQEIHFYDGNRGPLWHGADKIVQEPTTDKKDSSWFYKKEKGGGSLLDYLGYGTTLGTWFHGNKRPLEVSCMVDEPGGLEVDEHSVTIAKYDVGLSKFETRWGTFSDPWTHQPQPKCGFVIKGSDGTISSYDFEATVRLQTKTQPEGADIPVDELQFPNSNPVEYFLNCIGTNQPVDGPLSVEVSRVGQQIVDTAYASAAQKRTLPLIVE